MRNIAIREVLKMKIPAENNRLILLRNRGDKNRKSTETENLSILKVESLTSTTE